MNETLTLGLAGVAGLLLGGIFFGGLWWTVRWTVREGVTARRPALLFIGSFVLRASIVLAGIYLVARASGPQKWQPLLLCLLGMVVARYIVTWLTRSTEEARHAP